MKILLNNPFMYVYVNPTSSPVLPKLLGAKHLDPTGGAYSAPPNPPAALVEHQRCSITRYVSKKS